MKNKVILVLKEAFSLTIEIAICSRKSNRPMTHSFKIKSLRIN